MKILMPFNDVRVHNEGHQVSVGLNDAIVPGGIEKFSKCLKSIYGDDLIHVGITKEDRDSRRTKQILRDAITRHNPDIIFLNFINHWSAVKHFNIPVINVYHGPVDRNVSILNHPTIFKEMLESKVHMYFVSERQFRFHAMQVKRIGDMTITDSDIKGYINPSYCENMPFSESIYDIGTVGRSEHQKNPYAAHRLAAANKMSSLVITSDGDFKSQKSNDYIKKNSHWKPPQMTMKMLPHDEVLKQIASMGIYLSTCPIESWGITAMEALGCGVPSVYMTDSTGTHSSQSIAASPNHYITVHKSIRPADFKEAIAPLMKLSTEDRREIYEMTNEKHSKENFVRDIANVIERRLADKFLPNTLF
jgi:glycosyltransferase involved in cell wall biosynthesis